MAIAAALMCALAVLPGCLGVLIFTHKIAADSGGARFVFGHAVTLLGAATALMAFALYQVYPVLDLGDLSTLPLAGAGAVTVFVGVLVFGFFMHTRLNFNPVREPVFVSLDEAIEKFGPEEEVVGVIDGAGKGYAFVARLARRPHIVYQPEGEDPFLMSHCILAHSSMSYAMEGKFAKPDIDITAVMANNMVFYEKTNQCSVIQMHNQSREGNLVLRTVPTVACSLKTWQALYPDSPVWLRERDWRDTFYLKLLARAEIIDPTSPVMIYPLEHGLDERLPMKSNVNGVKIGDQNRTYPVTLSENERLVHDELGGTPILLVAAERGDFIQVFDRRIDGAALTFSPAAAGDNFTDNETGSEWAPTGDCVAGRHKGARLEPIPHYTKIFWYVWADFVPGSEIFAGAPARVTESAA